jgi:hypothetical protein
MLAAGDLREHMGNEGYDDDPAKHYSWDDTVAHHAEPAVGDVIALWDKASLVGASVIERIEEADSTKIRNRCPNCTQTGFAPRKFRQPRFLCRDCAHEFDEPVAETIAVHTYRTDHEPAWVDLQGRLDAEELRTLCFKPKAIQSLRELDWERFRARLADVGSLGVLRVVDDVRSQIAGGHRTVTTRVRIGQGGFRKALVTRYGYRCAITGDQPPSTLDAAHLYMYAEHGVHDDHGGFMLRRDVHRLFDLGLLCVHPLTLAVDLHADLLRFPSYSALHGQKLGVPVSEASRTWLRSHWDTHRAT